MQFTGSNKTYWFLVFPGMIGDEECAQMIGPGHPKLAVAHCTFLLSVIYAGDKALMTGWNIHCCPFENITSGTEGWTGACFWPTYNATWATRAVGYRYLDRTARGEAKCGSITETSGSYQMFIEGKDTNILFSYVTRACERRPGFWAILLQQCI